MNAAFGVKELHVKSYRELVESLRGLNGTWRPWDDLHRHMCGFIRDMSDPSQVGWVGIRVEPDLKDSVTRGELTIEEAREFGTVEGRKKFANRMSS